MTMVHKSGQSGPTLVVAMIRDNWFECSGQAGERCGNGDHGQNRITPGKDDQLACKIGRVRVRQAVTCVHCQVQHAPTESLQRNWRLDRFHTAQIVVRPKLTQPIMPKVMTSPLQQAKLCPDCGAKFLQSLNHGTDHAGMIRLTDGRKILPLLTKAESDEAYRVTGEGMQAIHHRISEGDAIRHAGRRETAEGVRTECTVHILFPDLCCCGGFDDWEKMPARISITHEAHGFGVACAEETRVAYQLHRLGEYPLTGVPTLRRAIEICIERKIARATGSSRVAEVVQTVSAERPLGAIQELIGPKPTFEQFPNSQAVQERVRKLRRLEDFFRASVPMTDSAAIFALAMEKGLYATVATEVGLLSASRRDRQVQICHGFAAEAEKIARELERNGYTALTEKKGINSGESPVVEHHSLTVAARAKKKAEKSAYDASLRAQMKGNMVGNQQPGRKKR